MRPLSGLRVRFVGKQRGGNARWSTGTGSGAFSDSDGARVRISEGREGDKSRDAAAQKNRRRKPAKEDCSGGRRAEKP